MDVQRNPVPEMAKNCSGYIQVPIQNSNAPALIKYSRTQLFEQIAIGLAVHTGTFLQTIFC